MERGITDMETKKYIVSLLFLFKLSIYADGSATYLPLNNVFYDKTWIMFGVNDFSNGVASSTKVRVTSFSLDVEVVTDTPTDDLATSGFKSSDLKNMGSVQALLSAESLPYFTALKVGIKSSDIAFTQTSPLRSMYIALENSPTKARIKLNYKATLEGRDIELQIDNATTILRTTISENATFITPAVARNTIKTSNNALLDLAKIEDVLVYDFTSAPFSPTAYSKSDHQGNAVGAERFYYYDAKELVWQVWDREKSGTLANTITHFEKGKSYWGKLDLDSPTSSSTINTSTNRAGLILGKSGLNEADSSVYADRLSSGWNMIALDPAAHPDIKNAATGLLITANAPANGDEIVILDETLSNSVVVTLELSHNDNVKIADEINEAIAIAKALATVPQSFNILAIATDVAFQFVLISDKKFTIKDDNGTGGTDAVLDGASTLAGGFPVLTTLGTKSSAAVVDVLASGVTSVYGEYSMIVEPIVGANSAAELDKDNNTPAGNALSAKVQFGNFDGDSKNAQSSAKPLGLASNDTTTTINSFATLLNDASLGDDVFNGTKSTGRAIELDSDFDGTTDMLLLSSDKPFYIKDNTFSRVYTVDTSSTGTQTADTFKIINSVSATLSVSANDVASNIATTIMSKADTGDSSIDTKTYAKVDPNDANKIIVVSSDLKIFDIVDSSNKNVNYFTKSVSSSDLAKGAIKRVLSLSKLARERLALNRFELDFASVESDGSGDLEITLVVNEVSINPIDHPSAVTSDETSRLAMLNGVVDKLNDALQTTDAPAFASHNYEDGMNDIGNAIIVVEGYGLSSVAFVKNGDSLSVSVSEKNQNAMRVDLDAGVVVSDLTNSAIYTPNFSSYGPLYTLKNAGYEAKAIVRASTKLAASPTTHWDHIDLTRDPQDWMKDNEYNVYSVDNASGYWAFLEPYTDQNSISVSNVSYTPIYRHQFNSVSDITTNIISSGQLQMELIGITEETSNVKAIVLGHEIELIKYGYL